MYTEEITRILITQKEGDWLIHINGKLISSKGKGKYKLIRMEE